jgi:hypothetical protein
MRAQDLNDVPTSLAASLAAAGTEFRMSATLPVHLFVNIPFAEDLAAEFSPPLIQSFIRARAEIVEPCSFNLRSWI